MRRALILCDNAAQARIIYQYTIVQANMLATEIVKLFIIARRIGENQSHVGNSSFDLYLYRKLFYIKIIEKSKFSLIIWCILSASSSIKKPTQYFTCSYWKRTHLKYWMMSILIRGVWILDWTWLNSIKLFSLYHFNIISAIRVQIWTLRIRLGYPIYIELFEPDRSVLFS